MVLKTSPQARTEAKLTMRNTLDEDKPRISPKVAARRRSRLQYRRLWIVSDREPSRSIDPDEAVVHGAALIDSVNPNLWIQCSWSGHRVHNWCFWEARPESQEYNP